MKNNKSYKSYEKGDSYTKWGIDINTLKSSEKMGSSNGCDKGVLSYCQTSDDEEVVMLPHPVSLRVTPHHTLW